nr:hypothetical protein BaRGS_006862 [Batillaria attramentaria]
MLVPRLLMQVPRLLMQVPRLPTQKRRGWPYPQLTLLPQETVLNTTSGIRTHIDRSVMFSVYFGYPVRRVC